LDIPGFFGDGGGPGPVGKVWIHRAGVPEHAVATIGWTCGNGQALVVLATVFEEIDMTTRDVTSEILALVSSPTAFTNIHIEEGMPIMIDSPKGWVAVDEFDVMFPVSREEMLPILSTIDAEWEKNMRLHTISRPYELSEWRLRVSACFASGKIVLAVRRQPKTPLPLDKLGLPLTVTTMAGASRGLVLVVGATNAGKTTTMAAMISHINSNRMAHICTIEDPIEYVHQRNRCIFTQREIGLDVTSFRQGVKDAMRLSPNVIMIGEIRDSETADIAMQAADSGHLVLASMHANGATSGITKMLSWFPEQEAKSRAKMLAESLVGVIFQSILPRVGGEGYVLASEIAFNNNHQLSEFIETNNIKGINDFLENREDKLSRSYGDSLSELVRSKSLDKKDALNAVAFGRSNLHDKINRVM